MRSFIGVCDFCDAVRYVFSIAGLQSCSNKRCKHQLEHAVKDLRQSAELAVA